MAATKRNAGLTSAIPRPTLNDEDLVNGTVNSVSLLTINSVHICPFSYILPPTTGTICRKCMSTRKPSKL